MLPPFLQLFCLAKTHLSIKVLFILYFISDPEFESELELELELIRSLESEQPHHDSAPPGLLISTFYMPIYYASPHVTIMGPVSRYADGKTHSCSHAYLFQQYQHLKLHYVYSYMTSKPSSNEKTHTP